MMTGAQERVGGAKLSDEQLRMQTTLDGISKLTIFANARRICKRQYQRSPNWVLAMELFGLGSTYAFALCREIGVDPEGIKARSES